GDVGVQAGQRVEQVPRLLRGTRAQFDQGARAGGGGCLPGPGEQDLPFGAGGVVLGQFGDPLEQLAAVRVVEPLRRQRPRTGGQAAADVGAQRRVRGVLGEGAGQLERTHVRGSSEWSSGEIGRASCREGGGGGG